MSTESSFFTEDFIRRYKEVYPLTDNKFRMGLHEILESPETMTRTRLTWMIKHTFPSNTSVYTISVVRVHRALKAGGAKLDALRTEVEERTNKIEWHESAEKLGRELQDMVSDPRIIN